MNAFQPYRYITLPSENSVRSVYSAFNAHRTEIEVILLCPGKWHGVYLVYSDVIFFLACIRHHYIFHLVHFRTSDSRVINDG